jgi:hypothetical protein
LARRLLVVGEPLGRGPRAEADRSLQQRAFDEPALAGALALVEGREDALNRPHPGAEIADREADRNRRPVGLAGHMHDSAHALRDQIEAAAPDILSGSKCRFPFAGVRRDVDEIV